MGDHSDGFSTTVLPSASGAAIERADRISAAFQGAIAPTTPTGRRRPIAKAPMSDGITSPTGAYASAAVWRKSPGTKCIWNMPKPNVDPVSRASSETTSSRRLSSTSAAFRKMPWRTAGGVCAQAGAAAAAASTARRASARVPAATSATSSPVNGSRSSNVRPSSASAQLPPMKSRLLVLSRVSALMCISLCSIRSVHHPNRWPAPALGSGTAAFSPVQTRLRGDLPRQCSIPRYSSLVSGT